MWPSPSKTKVLQEASKVSLLVSWKNYFAEPIWDCRVELHLPELLALLLEKNVQIKVIKTGLKYYFKFIF